MNCVLEIIIFLYIYTMFEELDEMPMNKLKKICVIENIASSGIKKKKSLVYHIKRTRLTRMIENGINVLSSLVT
jgi:hypothetical protein